MFDFDIFLFTLSMWNTTISYFDCSHVNHVSYHYKLFFCSSPDNGEYTEHKVEIQSVEIQSVQ